MAYTQQFQPFLTGSVSNSATMDINFANYYSLYNTIEIILVNLLPATNTVQLQCLLSADGTTFDNGASAYLSSYSYVPSTGSASGVASGAASFIDLVDQCDNTAAKGTSGRITIFGPNLNTYQPKIESKLSSFASGVFYMIAGAGIRQNAQFTKGIRFLYASGNITGSWSLYGYK